MRRQEITYLFEVDAEPGYCRRRNYLSVFIQVFKERVGLPDVLQLEFAILVACVEDDELLVGT